MNDKYRNFRWHRSASQKKKENYHGTDYKIEGDSAEKRCNCCKCRADHKCSHSGDREEVTGIRKILKDFGITGLSLGFVKKSSLGRNIFMRSGHEQESETKKEELRNNQKVTEVEKTVRYRQPKCGEVKLERIMECENLLRQFEMKLEDVKRQNTTWSYRDQESQAREDASAHSDECKNLLSGMSTNPSFTKEDMVVNSKVSLENGEDTDRYDHFVKEYHAEEHKVSFDDEKTENCVHTCCSLPPKIEIHSERTVCTCEKCSNIHYIDKHYLPTDVFKKCQKSEQGYKEEPTIHQMRSKKENFTSISERCMPGKSKDECTSATDLISANIEDSSEVITWQRKCEGTSHIGRVSERDEGTSSIVCASKKVEAISASRVKEEPDSVKLGQFGSDNVSENEQLINKSDLDVYPSAGGRGDESSSDHSTQKKGKDGLCDCEQKMEKLCDCSLKLKLIEDRLRMLEERKKTSELTVTSSKDKKGLTDESSLQSEKSSKVTTESSPHSESTKTPDIADSVTIDDREEAEKPGYDGRKRGTSLDSSSESEKSRSLGNVESETDVEVKTKVITCTNMNFFDGGDPDTQNKCQCTEDSVCPFRSFPGQKGVTTTKNIFFVTNIDLLRHWSGLYGSTDYTYCKSFWNLNDSALKPVKIQRDWRHVKTTVADFFRSKLRKKNFKFKRRNKSESFSKPPSSDSDEFLDDCSRSSRPLKKRSFLILGETTRPTRSGKERKKNSNKKSAVNKKKKKKSRKKS